MRDIRKVIEIESPITKNTGGNRGGTGAAVNEYLKHGWVLLAIHERGYVEPRTRETSHFTVYILGHTDENALPPGTWRSN